MMKPDPIPRDMHTVTPHLICDGAANAIAFYQQAFGAVELARIPAPNGRLMHAMIRIGDSPVMLVDENPQWGSLGPNSLQGTPMTLHLYVEDADAAFNKAVAAGATVKMPLDNMFWGDRYGIVIDPFGHQWAIASHVRDVPFEEIMAAADKMCQES